MRWERHILTPAICDEALAYEKLAAASTGLRNGQQVSVTGPLKQTNEGYQLLVRLFQI